MKIRLEEAVFRFRDHELNLTARGFSGEEWINGTAAKFYRQDYRRAVLEKDPTLDLLDDELELDFGQ
jgi:hypothetical protein